MEIQTFHLTEGVQKYLREKKIPKEWFYLLASLIVYRGGAEDAKTLTPETGFENDLGMDSLDKVQVVMDIERVFDIQIADDEAELFYTLADILEYLRRKVSDVKLSEFFELD